MIEINWSKVSRGLKNPKVAASHFFGSYVNQFRGVDFIQQDWDNLIILDGCRYDLFSEEAEFDGELSRVRSKASTSAEFMENNFVGRDLTDTVYFTANPHITEFDVKFHDIIPLWESDWDTDTGTVPPENVVNRVISEIDKYQEKRLIIHFMQPHRPFLGPMSTKIEQDGLKIDDPDDTVNDFWWDRLQNGEVEKDTVWNAYRETLEITLPEVQRLLSNISGKSVITADHGNAFGEDGFYGHPGYMHHWTLVDVPWLEISGDRRRISKGESQSSIGDKDTQDQLEALGYV